MNTNSSRKNLRSSVVLLLILAAMGLLGFMRSADAQSFYAVTDLGTLGGTYSYANGINDSGQVVGNSTTVANGTGHAFRTAANTAINVGTDDLGSLGGGTAYARAMKRVFYPATRAPRT